MKGRIIFLRLLGLALLAFLLWRIDTSSVVKLLRGGNLSLILVAFLLNIPLIFLRALRWQKLLSSAQVYYPIYSSILAYISSILIGLLTPGRLGELGRALTAAQDCNITFGRALGSVFADRFFDIYGLFFFGGIFLFYLGGEDPTSVFWLLMSGLVLTAPLIIFLNQRAFGFLEEKGSRIGSGGRRLFASQSWLMEMRSYLKQLPPSALIIAVFLTMLTFGVFFPQCYLLAQSLNLKASFLQIVSAVVLGTLVTLIPISVGGLGTREATIVAYLGQTGIPAEEALSFSLLVFLVFYVAGGVMGALGWWAKPIPVNSIARQIRN